MATDWNSPKTSDTHTNELAATRGRDESNARMDYTGDTNIPDGTIRWNKANNRFEIWSAASSTWSVLSSKYLINVDTVDGYHAGNASGNVPVSNGTVNTNLNSDKLDGQHGTFFQARENHTGTQAPSTISPQGSGSGLNADTVDGYHAGNASGNVPINNGTVNTNLNADKVDGQDASAFSLTTHNHDSTYLGITAKAADSDKVDDYHAGNASGNVPINNGTLNINLNADLLDGKHLSEIGGGIWDVIIEDQKPQGTDGGTFTSGAWQTRDLNTLVFNHNSLASLSNNRFTLPSGTYCIDWDAPAFRVNRHKTALYNYSSSTIVAYGTSELSSEGGATMNRSVGTKVVTISSSTSFTIQHICQSSYSNMGFGTATNFGTEVYTRVRIKKIA